MGEDRSGQVDGDFLEGLPLRLVDGLVVGVSVHDDTGNTDDVPYVAAREDLGLNDGAG